MDRTISLRERLENKTFKEKLDYIWTYYKLHILGTLILIFFVGSYISAQINRQDVYCNITYVGNTINVEDLTPAKDKLNDILLHNNKKLVINFDSIFTDDKSNAGLAMTEKLQVNIAAQQIDIAIVNKEFFNQNFSSDMFLNLESLNGFSELPISTHELIKNTDSNGINGTYGISVKNLNLLNNIQFANDDDILVVISNTKHSDAVVNVLKTFLA
ncbi:hypothetical protein [Clostridium sp.]|uniref:hypothetical protein n=1 Tax=Clostridium sp. TaxID=1506 RepID=UPI0028515D3F|nr:hypothetical protein [Clostridium sp.]MDR3598388.1 hypothetical protein [Clostridium sp.]